MAYDPRGSYRPPSPSPALTRPGFRPPSPGLNHHPSHAHGGQKVLPGQRYQAGVFGPGQGGASGGGGGYSVHALQQAHQPPRPQSSIGYSQPQGQYGMPMAYGSPPSGGGGMNGFGYGQSPVSGCSLRGLLGVVGLLSGWASGRRDDSASTTPSQTITLTHPSPAPVTTSAAVPAYGR